MPLYAGPSKQKTIAHLSTSTSILISILYATLSYSTTLRGYLYLYATLYSTSTSIPYQHRGQGYPHPSLSVLFVSSTSFSLTPFNNTYTLYHLYYYTYL